MRDRFVARHANLVWVLSGALVITATILALAMRESLSGGALPSALIALAILVAGLGGRGRRRLAGPSRGGALIFVAGSVWVFVSGAVGGALYQIVASPIASTGAVTFVDLAFVLLFAEVVRRGDAVDRRLWWIGVASAAAILLSKLATNFVSVMTTDVSVATVAVQVASLVVPMGTAALGGLLVFGGAAQLFGPEDEVKRVNTEVIITRNPDIAPRGR